MKPPDLKFTREGTVVNFREIDDWARRNSTTWSRANLAADVYEMTRTERLEYLAATLVLELQVWKDTEDFGKFDPMKQPDTFWTSGGTAPLPPAAVLPDTRSPWVKAEEDLGWSYLETVGGIDYGFPPEGGADPVPMPYHADGLREHLAPRGGAGLLIGLGLAMFVLSAVALFGYHSQPAAGLCASAGFGSLILAFRRPV